MTAENVAFVDTLAGCILSLWGVVKLILLFVDRCRKRRTQPFREIEEKLAGIMENLQAMDQQNKEQGEAIAALQLNELNTNYAYYVEKNRPCSNAVKTCLDVLYKQYTSVPGRNHVAQNFLEKLMALPTEKPCDGNVNHA